MIATFKEIRRFQGERIRMKFDDGREVVARLLCATRDMDGAKHIIYDRVESVDGGVSDGGSQCADGRTLVHIEHADPKEQATGPRRRDHLTMRSQFDQDLPRTLRSA